MQKGPQASPLGNTVIPASKSSSVIPLNLGKSPFSCGRGVHCLPPLLWRGKLTGARDWHCGEGISLCPVHLGTSSGMSGNYLNLFCFGYLFVNQVWGFLVSKDGFKFNKTCEVLSQQSYSCWETHLKMHEPRGQTNFCSYVHVFLVRFKPTIPASTGA